MAEYIEREALMKYADTQPGGLISNKSIQFFQAADVAPVRHGRWIDAREYCGDYMCSNCEALYGTNKFNYCPNCGAKMDSELK